MIVIIALGVFAGIAHEFVINEPIKYFSEDPSRLIPVFGIAVVYALLLAGYDRLPSIAKRIIMLLSWGLAACCMTLLFIYFAAISYSQLLETNSPDYLRMVIFGLVMIAIVTAYLWYEFYHTFKTKPSERKSEA